MIDCALSRTKVFRIVEGSTQHGRATVVVTCDRCGVEAQRTTKPSMPPQVLSKWFGHEGWRIEQDGRAALCPDCTGKRRAPEGPPAPVIELAPRRCLQCEQPIGLRHGNAVYCSPQCANKAHIARKAARKEADAMAAQHSPEALRNTRTLVRLLDQHFDEKSGRYAKGYNDQRIAGETGLALEFVVRFREETYGPLRDPELEMLEQTATELDHRIAREVKGLEDLLRSTKAELTSKLDDLRRRISKLEASR